MSENGRCRRKFSSFTSIPTHIAKAKMSARAKGIYLDICYLLDIEDAFPDNPNNKVTKAKIAQLSTEGKTAFETGWNELKEQGFIKVNKTNTSKHFTYSYDVFDVPQKNKNDEDNKEEAEEKKVDEQNTDIPTTYREATYDDIVKYINSRICYSSWQNKTLDDVIQDKDALYYNPEICNIYVRDIVDDIKNIIISVLMKKSKYIQIGKDKHSSNEVKSVLNKVTNCHISFIINSLYTYGFFTGELDITNMQAYLLTTIYNSILTYNASHMMSTAL